MNIMTDQLKSSIMYIAPFGATNKGYPLHTTTTSNNTSLMDRAAFLNNTNSMNNTTFQTDIILWNNTAKVITSTQYKTAV